jgi:uncharacterized protein (DUF2147 family)
MEVKCATAAFGGFILTTVLAVMAARGGTTTAAVFGDWLNADHRSVIHLGPCPSGGTICGSTVGLSDWEKDGSAKRDVNGASECQEIIIKGLVPAGDGRLHGTVTDPRDGTSYHALVWVGDDGILRLRGYIGVPMLGSTQLWEKFTGTRQEDCHFRNH